MKNMNKQISVDQWVAMFREIGLDEARMHEWHRVFEARHPQAHQSFLEWLGVSEKEIGRIRTNSRS